MLSTYYKLFLLSVKDLLKTIPSLNDKISEVENLTSQVSPFTNISEDIRKIKELIEQARDAANRVRSHFVHTSITKPKTNQLVPSFSLIGLISLFCVFSPDCDPDEVHRQWLRGDACAKKSGGSEGLHSPLSVAAETSRQG